MRKINEIILHCSGTEFTQDIGVKEIRLYHMNKRGWIDVGYHYIIRKDGTVEIGRPLYTVGAHCVGHNRHSIGICYIGGLKNGEPVNTLTAYQITALRYLIKKLLREYNLPMSAVHLHNEYSNKSCPCFTRKYLVDVLLANLTLY